MEQKGRFKRLILRMHPVRRGFLIRLFVLCREHGCLPVPDLIAKVSNNAIQFRNTQVLEKVAYRAL
jgi:hypothetical protein